MDFITTAAPPVPVTINGVKYNVPRFLRPQMGDYAAEQQKAHADRATAHLDADQKARFLMYFDPPPPDVLELSQRLRTAGDDGIGYVLDRQLRVAGVPDDVRAAFLANVDPQLQWKLADVVCSTRIADAKAAQQSEDPGSGADPLPAPPLTSGGSPTTTAGTLPPSVTDSQVSQSAA
jgi:hypothetical protein